MVPASLAQFASRIYSVTPQNGYQNWYDVTAAPVSSPAPTTAPVAIVTTGNQTSVHIMDLLLILI